MDGGWSQRLPESWLRLPPVGRPCWRQFLASPCVTRLCTLGFSGLSLLLGFGGFTSRCLVVCAWRCAFRVHGAPGPVAGGVTHPEASGSLLPELPLPHPAWGGSGSLCSRICSAAHRSPPRWLRWFFTLDVASLVVGSVSALAGLSSTASAPCPRSRASLSPHPRGHLSPGPPDLELRRPPRCPLWVQPFPA